MASLSSRRSSSSSSSTAWTTQENKLFEKALAHYDTDTSDRWQNISRAVGGGKTAEDCKTHFQMLLEDIWQIESGRVPFPNYMSS